MNTHTKTEREAYAACVQSKPQLDIEAHREFLRKRVAEKQAKEDAALAALSLCERMAVEVAAGVVDVCMGIIENVIACPTETGYLIMVDGVPTVYINVPTVIEPHQATCVYMTTPKKRIGPTANVSCHTVEDAVRFAVREIGE